MTDEQIIAMLSEIVEELDYDIWKYIFGEGYLEDEEDAADRKERLLCIVRKYIR